MSWQGPLVRAWCLPSTAKTMPPRSWTCAHTCCRSQAGMPMKLRDGLRCSALTSRRAARILNRTTYARYASCRAEGRAGNVCSAATRSTSDAWRGTGRLGGMPGSAPAAAA
eukprot:7171333-Alexandrium_andersonii.AAC.1